MLDSFKRFLKCIEMPILSNNRYEIHLKDTNASTKKNYCFKITNVPENTLVIRADKFPNMKHFFKDDEDIGLCKKSDYIIISIDKHSNYKVLIVEISSGDHKSNIYIRQQLKGATCILKYYESICKYFFNKTVKFNNIHYAGILLIGSPKKQKIDFERNSRNNTSPDNYFKISSGLECPYNKLVH